MNQGRSRRGVERMVDGAGALARWWLNEFRNLLPHSFITWLHAERRPQLQLHSDELGVTATLLDRRERLIFSDRAAWPSYARRTLDAWIKAAAKHDRSCEIVVSFAASDVITHKLVVPAEALPHISQILQDYVARKTPLAPDQVLIGHSATHADPGRLNVDLLLLSKDRFQQVLSRLQLLAREVDSVIGPKTASDALVRIRIGSKRSLGRPVPARLAVSLASISLLFVALGTAVTLVRHQALLNDLDARTKEMASSAGEVTEQLRRIQESRSETLEILVARGAPGIVEVWEELARLLPDSAYLTNFEIRGGVLQIAGFSAAATELIPILERSDLFTEVALSGPVLADGAKRKEQFSLRAKLRKVRFPAQEAG